MSSKSVDFLKRFVVVLVGSAVTGTGIGMAVSSGMGADPLAWVWQGLCLRLHVSMLTANLICAFIMIIPPVIWDRKHIGMGTVIQPFVLGIANSWVCRMLGVHDGNYALMLGGLVVMAIGVALYNSAESGRNSYDCIIFMIQERVGKPVGLIRSCGDFCLCAIAFVLCRYVVLGPFVAIVIVGPVLNITLLSIEKIKKLMNW